MKERVFSTKTSLFALGAAGSIIYLSLIFNNNLWVDEAFSACIIRGSFMQMLKGTFSDTLPPFYNIFTWLLTALFGYSPYVMKFSSALPMLLIMLWLSPFRIAGLYGDRTAAVFTIGVICAPHLLHYGVEIRPYSWGLFFASAAGVFALEILSSGFIGLKKYYTGFIIFSLLSGYTHQYALIPCIFLWFFLLISALNSGEDKKRALRAWGISLIIFILLYIPMLILTFFQLKKASGYFSMEPLSLRSFMSDLRFPYVTNITPVSFLLLAAALALFILCLISTFKNIRFAIPAILILIPYFTLIFGYICSFISDGSIFTSRYLIPSLGLFWLGLSIAAVDKEGFYPRCKTLIFTAVMIISLIVIYPQEFKSEYASGVNKMTDYFNENLGVNDGYIIYEDKYQIELCMRYYYPSFKKYDWENADECSGKLWYFAVDGYEDYLKQAVPYGYEPEFISKMNFDRYSFDLYALNPSLKD